jgi:hypothetical protein
MGLAPSVLFAGEGSSRPAVTVSRGGVLFDRLKEWRGKRANADCLPVSVVFTSDLQTGRGGPNDAVACLATIPPCLDRGVELKCTP